MRNFQDTFEICNRSFIKAFSICLTAPLSLFPTKFTLYLWDKEKNPLCSFDCFHTESMAHVLNGYINHFSNFYSRRYDRVMKIIASFLKESVRQYHIHIDKLSSPCFLR